LPFDNLKEKIFMDDPLIKISEILREVISPLMELQKEADPHPKQVLAKIVERLFTAQDLIGEIKVSKQAILDEKENLSKKIMQYEQTIKDSSEYESFRLISRSTVIIPKSPDKPTYAKEWYCKTCFDKFKKVELQPVPKTFDSLICPDCGANIWLTPSDVILRNKHLAGG